MPTAMHNWITRRRIHISLVCFTTLILFNVFILQTTPLNPLALNEPLAAFGGLTLLLGLALRSWSAGTLKKSRELTTIGPYALVRNPLYVGSFMMMIGFCVLCRDLPTALFVIGPLAYLYWYQVRVEEIRLAEAFPTQWSGYVQATPRFVPLKIGRDVLAGWSAQEWLRNREYQAILATALGVYAICMWHYFRSPA